MMKTYDLRIYAVKYKNPETQEQIRANMNPYEVSIPYDKRKIRARNVDHSAVVAREYVENELKKDIIGINFSPIGVVVMVVG